MMIQYDIKDVLDSLNDKCEKRAYVWICRCCVNKHHIGKIVTLLDKFCGTFYSTVTGVGTVWPMVAPWNKPIHLECIWCIFLGVPHTANTADRLQV